MTEDARPTYVTVEELRMFICGCPNKVGLHRCDLRVRDLAALLIARGFQIGAPDAKGS